MPARLTDPNPLDLQLDQDQGELYDYYQDAAETFFELPLSSETLFFLSRGDRLAGAIQVKTSADQAPDSASVHILIRYRTHIIIERTKACLVKRNANENGVGLFVSHLPCLCCESHSYSSVRINRDPCSAGEVQEAITQLRSR